MPVNLNSVYPPPLKLEPFRKKGSAGFSRDWQQILSGLQQRHIQQGRKTVAGFDFGTRPVRVVWSWLRPADLKCTEIQVQNRLSLFGLRQVQKIDPVKAFGPSELGW